MGVPGVAAPPPSGSKKRAYEALERRFGSNLQKSAPQESKAKKAKASGSRVRKRDVARDAGRRWHLDRSDIDSCYAKDEVSVIAAESKGISSRADRDSDVGDEGPLDHPDTKPSSTKGKTPTNAPFCKNTPLGTSAVSDDSSGKAQHPAYFALSRTVNVNLIRISEKDTSNGAGYATKFMHDLLLNGDCSQKYMKGMQNMKFDEWFLLDNLVSSSSGHAKSLQNHSRRSKKHMSMKQHRKYGSFDLPREFHSFDLFKPMHEMWKDYITKLLKDTRRNQMSSCLLTADLHGALLLVVECKTMDFTGLKGIMVRETTETFGIVTVKNKFRVVPKRGSIFIFQAGSWKITLVGDKLSSRTFCK